MASPYITDVQEPIVEVSEQTFQEQVLDRSAVVPVVVDFWAAWCGPCRRLGPMLERLVREAKGAFVLAKVDVDANPRLAAFFGIQGIPAVKAFRNGEMVDEFVGAQPEPVVRDFLQRLGTNGAKQMTGQVQALESAGRWAEAEASYRTALEEQPDDPAALLGLGRALLRQGQWEEAMRWLEQVPVRLPEGREAEELLAQARLQSLKAECGDEAECRRRRQANPSDLEARFCLAVIQASRGETQPALEELLSIVAQDRHYRDDGARKLMVDIFAQLGDENPLTREYRSRLASLLF